MLLKYQKERNTKKTKEEIINKMRKIIIIINIYKSTNATINESLTIKTNRTSSLSFTQKNYNKKRPKQKPKGKEKHTE